MFFNSLHPANVLFKTVEKSNLNRKSNSLFYFSSIEPSSSLALYKQRLRGGHIDFAIAFITINRADINGKPLKHGYLLQSVSYLDSMLKKESVLNNSIGFVCNVDAYPSKHSDANYLYPYVPFVERYGNNSLGLKDLCFPHTKRPFKDITSHASIYQKETYDYVFCMQAAAELKPRFILLIEEDTLPHKQFPTFLDHLINFRLKEYNMSNLAFIKLYYPSKWQGFSVRFSEIIDLLSFCILETTASFFIGKSLFRSLNYVLNDRKFLIVNFILSLCTCYIVGRQNLNELRRISSHFYRMESSESCCTQAMLYPIEVIDQLPLFMISESMSTHTDLIISDFVKEKELSAYQIEPNLFYHTGLHSSLPLEAKHPVEFIVPE